MRDHHFILATRLLTLLLLPALFTTSFAPPPKPMRGGPETRPDRTTEPLQAFAAGSLPLPGNNGAFFTFPAFLQALQQLQQGDDADGEKLEQAAAATENLQKLKSAVFADDSDSSPEKDTKANPPEELKAVQNSTKTNLTKNDDDDDKNESSSKKKPNNVKSKEKTLSDSFDELKKEVDAEEDDEQGMDILRVLNKIRTGGPLRKKSQEKNDEAKAPETPSVAFFANLQQQDPQNGTSNKLPDSDDEKGKKSASDEKTVQKSAATTVANTTVNSTAHVGTEKNKTARPAAASLSKTKGEKAVTSRKSAGTKSATGTLNAETNATIASQVKEAVEAATAAVHDVRSGHKKKTSESKPKGSGKSTSRASSLETQKETPVAAAKKKSKGLTPVSVGPGLAKPILKGLTPVRVGPGLARPVSTDASAVNDDKPVRDKKNQTLTSRKTDGDQDGVAVKDGKEKDGLPLSELAKPVEPSASFGTSGISDEGISSESVIKEQNESIASTELDADEDIVQIGTDDDAVAVKDEEDDEELSLPGAKKLVEAAAAIDKGEIDNKALLSEDDDMTTFVAGEEDNDETDDFVAVEQMDRNDDDFPPDLGGAIEISSIRTGIDDQRLARIARIRWNESYYQDVDETVALEFIKNGTITDLSMILPPTGGVKGLVSMVGGSVYFPDDLMEKDFKLALVGHALKEGVVCRIRVADIVSSNITDEFQPILALKKQALAFSLSLDDELSNEAGLDQYKVLISYRDQDGDNLAICSTSDLISALTGDGDHSRASRLRVLANVTAVSSFVPAAMGEQIQYLEPPFIHGSHTCDGCMTSPIIGKRFHATGGDDFDLCEACMNNYQGEINFEEDVLDDDIEMQELWLRELGMQPDFQQQDSSSSQAMVPERPASELYSDQSQVGIRPDVQEDPSSEVYSDQPQVGMQLEDSLSSPVLEPDRPTAGLYADQPQKIPEQSAQVPFSSDFPSPVSDEYRENKNSGELETGQSQGSGMDEPGGGNIFTTDQSGLGNMGSTGTDPYDTAPIRDDGGWDPDPMARFEFSPVSAPPATPSPSETSSYPGPPTGEWPTYFPQPPKPSIVPAAQSTSATGFSESDSAPVAPKAAPGGESVPLGAAADAGTISPDGAVSSSEYVRAPAPSAPPDYPGPPSADSWPTFFPPLPAPTKGASQAASSNSAVQGQIESNTQGSPAELTSNSNVNAPVPGAAMGADDDFSVPGTSDSMLGQEAGSISPEGTVSSGEYVRTPAPSAPPDYPGPPSSDGWPTFFPPLPAPTKGANQASTSSSDSAVQGPMESNTQDLSTALNSNSNVVGPAPGTAMNVDGSFSSPATSDTMSAQDTGSISPDNAVRGVESVQTPVPSVPPGYPAPPSGDSWPSYFPPLPAPTTSRTSDGTSSIANVDQASNDGAVASNTQGLPTDPNAGSSTARPDMTEATGPLQSSSLPPKSGGAVSSGESVQTPVPSVPPGYPAPPSGESWPSYFPPLPAPTTGRSPDTSASAGNVAHASNVAPNAQRSSIDPNAASNVARPDMTGATGPVQPSSFPANSDGAGSSRESVQTPVPSVPPGYPAPPSGESWPSYFPPLPAPTTGRKPDATSSVGNVAHASNDGAMTPNAQGSSAGPSYGSNIARPDSPSTVGTVGSAPQPIYDGRMASNTQGLPTDPNAGSNVASPDMTGATGPVQPSSFPANSNDAVGSGESVQAPVPSVPPGYPAPPSGESWPSYFPPLPAPTTGRSPDATSSVGNVAHASDDGAMAPNAQGSSAGPSYGSNIAGPGSPSTVGTGGNAPQPIYNGPMASNTQGLPTDPNAGSNVARPDMAGATGPVQHLSFPANSNDAVGGGESVQTPVPSVPPGYPAPPSGESWPSYFPPLPAPTTGRRPDATSSGAVGQVQASSLPTNSGGTGSVQTPTQPMPPAGQNVPLAAPTSGPSPVTASSRENMPQGSTEGTTAKSSGSVPTYFPPLPSPTDTFENEIPGVLFGQGAVGANTVSSTDSSSVPDSENALDWNPDAMNDGGYQSEMEPGMDYGSDYVESPAPSPGDYSGAMPNYFPPSQPIGAAEAFSPPRYGMMESNNDNWDARDSYESGMGSFDPSEQMYQHDYGNADYDPSMGTGYDENRGFAEPMYGQDFGPEDYDPSRGNEYVGDQGLGGQDYNGMSAVDGPAPSEPIYEQVFDRGDYDPSMSSNEYVRDSGVGGQDYNGVSNAVGPAPSESMNGQDFSRGDYDPSLGNEYDGDLGVGEQDFNGMNSVDGPSSSGGMNEQDFGSRDGNDYSEDPGASNQEDWSTQFGSGAEDGRPDFDRMGFDRSESGPPTMYGSEALQDFSSPGYGYEGDNGSYQGPPPEDPSRPGGDWPGDDGSGRMDGQNQAETDAPSAGDWPSYDSPSQTPPPGDQAHGGFRPTPFVHPSSTSGTGSPNDASDGSEPMNGYPPENQSNDEDGYDGNGPKIFKKIKPFGRGSYLDNL